MEDGYIVILIAKPGRKGHRPPIFLLSTLSKITEIIILAKLLWKTPKTKNIFECIKDRSTLDTFVHLVTKITARNSTKRKKPVFVVFMDLDKAFERIDHPSVLEYVISLGTSGRIITKIEDVLKLKIHGTISDLHGLTTGCPHGSTISPVIFNGLVTLHLTVTQTSEIPKCSRQGNQ